MTDNLISASDHARVPTEALRWECDPSGFAFETTAELDPVQEIIGQDRALRAMRIGLEMKSPGYNIFLAGFVGTGRNTTVQRVLQKLDRGTEPPPDLCYVHNFENPDRPKALSVPAGMGSLLRARMNTMVEHLTREIPRVFESDTYRKRRKRLEERFEKRQRETIEGFDKRMKGEGFALVEVQVGTMTSPELVPLVEGEARFFHDLEEAAEKGEFDAERLKLLHEQHRAYSDELQDMIRTAIQIDEERRTRVAKYDKEAARPIVTACFWEIREGLTENPDVADYLRSAEQHVLEHLLDFAAQEESDDESSSPHAVAFARYRVNLIVDNSKSTGAPVVLEYVPTMAALFGIVERSWSKAGEEPADHLDIRAGALHQSNGGYLILNGTDLFSEPGSVWNTLKRTLRTGYLEIPPVTTSVLGPPAMKPERIPINVKVVLIGDTHLYSTLYHYDDDFKKIFKVRADFDTEMVNVDENLRLYGSFIQRLVAEERVLPFDRQGLAEIVEYGSRLAGRQDRLSTRFNMIADLVRESSYFALKESQSAVAERHVRQAVEERDYRNNLSQEKMLEMIDEGTIFIDVEGAKIGEVNGLAVYESGEHAFGLPTKITATVSMGNAGIINIEREAELSGRTHDKGVQILAGYLRARYAQDKPLALSASICFEQSYHGVDGDSASSTEIYAILSALAEIPIRQDLAVTGSMSQVGLVQPIGGVNEKIEGFFDVCRAKGLTGTQGVIMPKANLPDLMLHKRVVEAVRAGNFHVYAIETIDDGIEVLTGIAAGHRAGSRTYPRNTVNGRVDARLKRLAKQMRDYGNT